MSFPCANDAVLTPNNTFYTLFGGESVTGPCLGEFSCSQNRIPGYLYVTARAVYFYSNLFGYERKVSLKYRDVVRMELYRTTSIRITMYDGEYFLFRSFQDRENVLRILNCMKLEAAPRKTRRGTSAPSPKAPDGLTSDSHNTHATTSITASTSSPATLVSAETRTRDNAASNRRLHFLSARHSAANSSSHSLDSSFFTLNDTDHASEHQSLQQQPSPRPVRSNRRRSVSDSLLDPHLLSREESGDRNKKPVSKQQAQDNTDDETVYYDGDSLVEEEVDPAAQWELAKTRFQSSAGNPTVEALEFPCSLDQFYQLLLADDALYSLVRFQKEIIGDKNVEMTKWNVANNDAIEQKTIVSNSDGVTKSTRTMSFEHILKKSFGMGPSEAHTTREQELHRYAKLGILLESKTTVKGVPSADAFYVQDVWIVEAKPTTSTEHSKVVLRVRSETHFIKRAMLRGVIEASITKEAKEWFAAYRNFVIAALQSQSALDQAELERGPATAALCQPDQNDVLLKTNESLQRIARWLENLFWCAVVATCMLFGLLLWQCFTLRDVAAIAQAELASLRLEVEALLQKNEL